MYGYMYNSGIPRSEPFRKKRFYLGLPALKLNKADLAF